MAASVEVVRPLPFPYSRDLVYPEVLKPILISRPSSCESHSKQTMLGSKRLKHVGGVNIHPGVKDGVCSPDRTKHIIYASGPGHSCRMDYVEWGSLKSRETDKGIGSTIVPFTLDKLPFEIREMIAQECLQADAFHLCATNHALYESTVARLYQCIIFDSSHRIFNKEIFLKRRTGCREDDFSCSEVNSDRDNSQSSLTGTRSYLNTSSDSGPYFSYTSVRTVGGIRECLRALDRPDGYKASLVKRFECLNSMDLPDLEVKKFMHAIFPKMTNLKCLVWNCSPEMTVDMLQDLACPLNITTLSLDMALRSDSLSRQISHMTFANLTHLVIRPYLTSDILKLLAKMIINSCCVDLKSLYLGRELLSDHEIGSGFAFASINALNNRTQEHHTACMAFFGTLAESMKGEMPRLKLARLGLDGFLVRGSDVKVIDQCVDLSHLKHLTLTGTESESPDGSSIDSIPVVQTFLQNLIGKTPNLEALDLDWSQKHLRVVPQYLCSLVQGIKSLSVKIHWDESNTDTAISWTSLCQEYAQAIIGTHGKTLTNLEIEAVKDTAYSDPYKIIPKDAIGMLRDCTKLIGLSIPMPRNSVAAATDLIACLPKLRYLQLKNQSSKPYLGQTHSYLLEDWMRYKYIVDGITQAQESVEYLKLEKYVFDVRFKNEPAVIRDGLNKWFDSQLIHTWEI